MRLTIAPVRTQISWHGTFAKPVFWVLANPSSIYAQMYDALRPYGADLRNLGIDLTNLSQSEITCSLLDRSTMVRLRLDRLEIAQYAPPPAESSQTSALIDAVVRALAEADAALAPVRIDLSVDAWAAIKDGSYQEWVAAFIQTPTVLGPIAHQFAVRGDTWTLSFEPSARFVENGFFYRFTSSYAPSASSQDHFVRAGEDLLKLLAAFEVHIP